MAHRTRADPPRPDGRGLALALGAVMLLAASGAQAGEVTAIADGYAPPDDPAFDFDFETSWDFEARRGDIHREFRCVDPSATSAAGKPLCPERSRIRLADSLQFDRTIHVLNLDSEFAFGQVFAFHLRLPVVLQDQTNLEFADGVNDRNSQTDPYNRASLFSVPHRGPSRTGLGDPVVGLRVTPLSRARDPDRATWAVNLDLTFPRLQSDRIRRADNAAVGDGIWELDLSTGISARPVEWVEPYFRAGGTVRVPAANSLFNDYGRTQILVGPGHGIHVGAGTEFLPFEDRSKRRTVAVDIGARFDYRFEGREYTPLFEALGTSDCDPRDPEAPCDRTTFDRVDPATGQRRKTKGLTDVQQYGTLSAWLGVRYQPVRWVELGTRFNLGYELPHYLTFADAGRDLDNRNDVEQRNSNGTNEFNPVYNSSYDAPGRRFRSAGFFNYGVTLSVEVHY